MFEPFCLYF